MATQNSEKPIHSIIIDTGPLINNTVSISTIINSAEVLYTTPAIIAEIRDPATRSRVETTLLPFLNIKTPSPTSFEAVSEFAKKTGDYSVLSKQDLGILALAYEVHCEKNGGSFGLRSTPKGPLNLRPEEQAKVNEENAKKETEKAKKTAEHEAAEARKKAKKSAKEASVQRRKEERNRKKKEEAKAAAVSKKEAARNTQNTSEVTQTQQEATEKRTAEKQTSESTAKPQGPSDDDVAEHAEEEFSVAEALPLQENESAAPVAPRKRIPNQKTIKKRNRRARKRIEEKAPADIQAAEGQSAEEVLDGASADAQESSGGVDLPDTPSAIQKPEENLDPEQIREPEQVHEPEQIHEPEDTRDFEKVSYKKPHPAKARLARRAAEREALAHQDVPSVAQQPTPPATSDEESDGGEWITPDNLSKHQAGTEHVPLRKDEPQLDVATMTTDYAMQNVLLQMNLLILSPAMQRIRNARSTIMRCHACFLTTRQMDKQFCPRCGQPTLQRVTCSTNAKGEFQVHLSSKYQHNKRGDKYSIPKPVGGTSNGKMRGPGGGKSGWGRELVLSEDQKEYQQGIIEQKKAKSKDLLDDDFLPNILTGHRSQADGKVKIGAGRNVNSRKRI